MHCDVAWTYGVPGGLPLEESAARAKKATSFERCWFKRTFAKVLILHELRTL